MFQDTLAVTYSGNGKAVSATTGTYNGDTDAGFDTTVAAGATVEIDCVFPHAIATTATGLGMLSWVLAADGPLTVKTNDLTTPGNTFLLAKNAPKAGAWDWPSPAFCAADVTKVFLINAGTSPVNVHFRTLYNSGH